MTESKMHKIVIGDIHGDLSVFNDIYKKEKENAGREPLDVTLLGDYFDSHEGIRYEEQVEAFKRLLGLQHTHSRECGKFTMLIGNHDFHYLDNSGTQKYSEYSVATYAAAHDILVKAREKKLVKFADVDVHNKTVYSHAGVTNEWLVYRGKISNPINMIDLLPHHLFNFTYGRHMDFYGNDPLNGPLWVRPEALLSDLYKDDRGDVWTQVVGHTRCKKPIVAHEDGSQWKDGEPWQFAKLWDIDCLDKGYYLLETLDEDMKIVNREIKNIYK